MHVGLTGWQREAADGDHHGLLDLFRQADSLGFDSLWLPELHLRRTGLMYPSPLLLAAAVLAVTERMRVGTGVTLLPIQHPLLLAEQLAQLDVQSSGRLDVGIGRGADDATLLALGLDPDTKHERFVASYEIVLRAWGEDRIAATHGPWQFGEVGVGPIPYQRPHPPIFVAGTSRETLTFAIERRLPLLLSLEPPESRQLDRRADLLGARITDAEQVADLWRSSVSRYVFIGRTNAEAYALLDRALPFILQRRRWAPVNIRDADAVRRARADLIRDQAIVGDPGACIDAIARLVRRVGTGHLRCVFNALGGLDRATTLSQLALFAAEVLPICRTIGPP